MSDLLADEAAERAKWERALVKEWEARHRAEVRERRKKERALERAWHCIYFMYDAKDRLLYVGISANGPSRMRSHASVQKWWRKVVRIEVEHVKGREAALTRELELIRTLDPLWNVAGLERAVPVSGRQVTKEIECFACRAVAVCTPTERGWTCAVCFDDGSQRG